MSHSYIHTPEGLVLQCKVSTKSLVVDTVFKPYTSLIARYLDSLARGETTTLTGARNQRPAFKAETLTRGPVFSKLFLADCAGGQDSIQTARLWHPIQRLKGLHRAGGAQLGTNTGA